MELKLKWTKYLILLAAVAGADDANANPNIIKIKIISISTQNYMFL